MTFEEFKEDVLNNIESLPNSWRKGQKVFNYIDWTYKVARKVQFDDKIDCFYNDQHIDNFIKQCYNKLSVRENK